MKEIIILFTLLLFSHSLIADEIDCKKKFEETKKALKTIRENIKIGKDINDEFLEYEMGMDELVECPEYEKRSEIKVKDNEIAGFRKFMHAPDRSANLTEDRCEEAKVSTEHMPKNSNQKQLSWCFAWPTADLISFHEKTPVSAYDIAFQYHNDDETREANNKDKGNTGKKTTEIGGVIINAMNIALGNKGICLESETDYLNGNWDANSDLFKLMSDSSDSFSQYMCIAGLATIQPFNQLDKNIIDVLDKLSSDKKMAAFLDLTCNKRHQVKNEYRNLSQWIGRPGVTKDKMINKLDGLLSKGEPVSVTYDHKILTHGENYVGKKADHASTVIGRKFNKSSGQCEYLIKNSWGDDVDCQLTSSVKCVKGNYWVNRTSLMQNLNEINWLEMKKPTPKTEIQK